MVVGVRHTTLSTACFMDPKLWGPSAWEVIHKLSVTTPPTTNENHLKQVQDLFPPCRSLTMCPCACVQCAYDKRLFSSARVLARAESKKDKKEKIRQRLREVILKLVDERKSQQ